MTSNAMEGAERMQGRGEAPGSVLGEARLAQNLSVADVARQLKLSIGQVEALEAGDFQRLPGPVFARGFVRNYARLLRLDAEPLLKSLAVSLPREEPLPPAPPSQDIPFPTAAPRRWRAYAAVVAAIVAALAIYEFFPGGARPTASEPPAATPAPAASAERQPPVQTAPLPDAAQGGAVVAAYDATRVGGPTQAKADASTVTPVPDGAQSTTQVAATVAAAQDTPPTVAKSAAREDEPAPGPGERQVHMVFDQASWVEIRDRSGKAIFSQLNPRGTEQRVNGRPPLAVVVGNAHGVRLTYDERPVNLSLHTKVDVARLTLQ